MHEHDGSYTNLFRFKQSRNSGNIHLKLRMTLSLRKRKDGNNDRIKYFHVAPAPTPPDRCIYSSTKPCLGSKTKTTTGPFYLFRRTLFMFTKGLYIFT